MEQSQAKIEIVEPELISDSPNESINASLTPAAVEIARESLAGQTMEQSQAKIEIVEPELISDSPNESIDASMTPAAVEIARESLAGQTMEQSQAKIEIVEPELISDSPNESIDASITPAAVEIARESLAGQTMEQSQAKIEIVEPELISDSPNESIDASITPAAVEITRESLAGQTMEQSQAKIEIVEPELISDSPNESIDASITPAAVEITRESLAGQTMEQSQAKIEIVEPELISDSPNESIDASMTPAAVEIARESLAGQTMEQSQAKIEIVEPELISDSPNESIDASMTPAAVEIARESLAGQTMEQSQAKIEIVEPELISDSPNESIDASITPAAVEIAREPLAGQTMDQSEAKIEIVEPELISDSPNESIDASMTPAAVEIAREPLAGQTMEQSQAKIEIVEPELISDSPNESIDASLTPAAVEIAREPLAGQTMEQSQAKIEIVEPELISDSPNESIDASLTPAAVEIAREPLAGQTMEQSQAKIEIVEPELISDSPNESIDASMTPAAVEITRESLAGQTMDQSEAKIEFVEPELISDSANESIDTRMTPTAVEIDLQSAAEVIVAVSNDSDKIVNVAKKRKLFSKTNSLTLNINSTESSPQRLSESKYPDYVIENDRVVSGKRDLKKDDTIINHSIKSPIKRRQLPSRAARNRIVTLSEEELAGKSPKVKYCKPKNNTLSDSSSSDFVKIDEKRKIIFNDVVDIKEFNSPNIEGDIIKKTKTRRLKGLNENSQNDINPTTKAAHEEPIEFPQPLKDNAVTSTPCKSDLESINTKILMPPESPAIRRTRRIGAVFVDSPALLTSSSTPAELSVDTQDLSVHQTVLEESSQVQTPSSGKGNQPKKRPTRSRKQLTVPEVTEIREELIDTGKESSNNTVLPEQSTNNRKKTIENKHKTQEEAHLLEELPKKRGRKAKQLPISRAKQDLKETSEVEKSNADTQNSKLESPKKVGSKRRVKDVGSTEVKDIEPENLPEQKKSKQAKQNETFEDPNLNHNGKNEKQAETNTPKKRGNKKKINHEESHTKEEEKPQEETIDKTIKEQYLESKPPMKKGRTLKKGSKAGSQDKPPVTEQSGLAVGAMNEASEAELKEESTEKQNLEQELPKKRGRKKKITENETVESTKECPADVDPKGENVETQTVVEDLPKKRGRKIQTVQEKPIETKNVLSANQKTTDPATEMAGDEIDKNDTKKRGKTSKRQVAPSPAKSSTESNASNAEIEGNGMRTRSRRAKQAI
ncbi:enolase-phosphatase E1-like [Anopheles aquasalis]|uniref:enolase-phosphatase E1-like n=1 Tax=Anopheles aquasalis TaxID=42839 RepID=UPI00215A1EF4|nr:enolase-phosphatase E1-like [Anopheles aquasalis]